MGLAIAQRLQLPELVGRLLAARAGPRQRRAISDAALKDLLPDPGAFRDMDQAAAFRLVAAIERRGKRSRYSATTTSTAPPRQLCCCGSWCAKAGAAIRGSTCRIAWIEGYGPERAGAGEAAGGRRRPVITVDCGITLRAAGRGGAPSARCHCRRSLVENAPALAAAVVNPNRLDETGGAWSASPRSRRRLLLVVALNPGAAGEKVGTVTRGPSPDLLQWLDIVALGTVCDVVPLTGVNRALVTQGLKVMAQRRNVGWRPRRCGRNERAADRLSRRFSAGPPGQCRGRVGKFRSRARLLSTDNPLEAKDIAQHWMPERRTPPNRGGGAGTGNPLAEGRRRTICTSYSSAGRLASRRHRHRRQPPQDRFERPACVVALDQDAGRLGPFGQRPPSRQCGDRRREAGIIAKGGGCRAMAGLRGRGRPGRGSAVFFAARLAINLGGVP